MNDGVRICLSLPQMLRPLEYDLPAPAAICFLLSQNIGFEAGGDL
jgi:hypothetical protein